MTQIIQHFEIKLRLFSFHYTCEKYLINHKITKYMIQSNEALHNCNKVPKRKLEQESFIAKEAIFIAYI